MKKIWNLLLLFTILILGFSSCSNDNSWRDDNLAFIDNLKNKEGIYEIGDSINGYSGIYYQIITKGTGKIPVSGNFVRISYAGWLWNDTTTYQSTLSIDDVFTKNDNYKFTVGSDKVAGLNLAVERMPVGSEWKVYIPYNLGYGSSGSDSVGVSGYSTLIYDINLKGILADNSKEY
jgi:hypothetical protein